MMRRQLTTLQRRQLLRAVAARQNGDHGGWIRSQDHGQRVTLASLHYRGFMDRRAWAKAGTSSPAHEYRITDELFQALLRAQGRWA